MSGLIEDVFGAGGKLSRLLQRFEVRHTQMELAAAVERLLHQGGLLFAEADTGTGKSLAYLVPLIECARRGGAATVVATYTKNLQDQLAGRDVPLAAAATAYEVPFAVAKGRTNYLCLRRLNRLAERQDTPPRLKASLDALLTWSYTTRTGEREEAPVGDEVFYEVASDGLACGGAKCPFFRQCFYQNMRKRLSAAEVIITNHALLFSDLISGAGVLPDYAAVVLDEGHRVPDAILSAATVRFSLPHILKLLEKAQREAPLAEVKFAAEQCQNEAKRFFAQIEELRKTLPESGRITKPPDVSADAFVSALARLASVLKMLSEKSLFDDRLEQNVVAEKMVGLCEQVMAFCRGPSDNEVFWVEGRDATVCLAPVEADEIFTEQLLSRVASVAVVGATLSVGGEFLFLMRRLGVGEATTLRLPPSFDYRNAVRLLLYRNFPEPDEGGWQEAVAEEVWRLVVENRGAALVLFTSYEALQKTAKLLERRFSSAGIPLLLQGSRPRSILLEEFRNTRESVLFGTESFWQGVDVPGASLTLLVITRLPFDVPSRPEIEARLERIRNAGGNPFYEYQLPEAVLKLRQGFGRLIRHSEDRGTVAILDSRITHRRYGRVFLRALPPCQVEVR